MIPQAKLDSLSAETLNALIDGCKTALEKQRATQVLKHGSMVTFYSTKRCRQVIMRIDRFNVKNLSGLEFNEDGSPTALKWRVHPSFVTLVKPRPKAVVTTPQHQDTGMF